ncbi:MAG: hypothetical protein P8Z79_01960, partial [Sedimentisphaerales bacterium]
MMCNRFASQLIFVAVLGPAGLFSLTGCAPHDYKKEADEQVYRIIDQKWDPNFGTKANYKISDTPPSPNDIQVSKEVTDFGILTLPLAVALATAHNREYQNQREDLYIKALDLRLTRHDFETQFFGGGSAGYNADRNDGVAGAETNIGFNRLLAGGTRISAELAGAWAEVLSGNLRSGLASILSFSVVQPLLRGSSRRVVLENLTQAERDTLYQIRAFNRFRKEFVVSVVSQYYRVLQRLDAVKNARNNYATLVRLGKSVEDLVGAGRLPLFEQQRIEQEILQAENISSQAETDYKQALDEFKITLSLPATAQLELDETEFEALQQAGMTEPNLVEEKVINAALAQRLDVANSADAIIDAQRKVYVATDSLRAEANIIGTTQATTARRADRRSLDWLREEYGLGVELDLALDRVPEQTVYRA